MRDLYMSNGTLYIVAAESDRGSWPDFRYITSTGLPGYNTPENIAAREPTERDMAFITPEEAFQRWGPSVKGNARNSVWTVRGNTVSRQDLPSLLSGIMILIVVF
jgi:hypothetical protein